jgi:quinol monooxygenase YgiN
MGLALGGCGLRPGWACGGAMDGSLPGSQPSASTVDAVASGRRIHSMIQASFRIVAPADKRGEILDVLLRLKGPTEVSRGCRACRILQDVENAQVLYLLLQWESESDLEAHLRSERFRHLLPYIEMSTDPPQIDFSTIDRVGGVEFLVAALGTP